MPRSLVVGNGNVLVGFDANYSVRDIYFPRVGDANQTMGNVCRTGFFIDGKFAWVEDSGWERQLGYAEDSLVTAVTLKNARLGISVKFQDFVDMARNWFIRSIEVSSETGFNTGRVFFHYDWYIEGSDLGNTVAYDPRHKAVIAYKANRYFLVGGDPGPGFGIDMWANGKKGGSLAGTWVDAQDGELGRNPIEQGSVDCTVGFNLVPVAPGGPCVVTHWVCMGARLSEVTVYGQDLIIGKGPDTYMGRTVTYWQVWSEKDHRHIDEELGGEVTKLYRRSILTARTHVDNHGAIIAATDFDITKFARDTYAYAWPRDGALVANALDRAGHEDVTRNFFTYCQQCLVEEGFFLHKYTAYGLPGSSWLPWVDRDGNITLPIQEDETGLVLWALWQHFRIHRNLDFIVELYTTLVVPAADWMVTYVDERNGLIKPSWDLWEERWGVHAFTVGAVWGGLDAARSFAELFGDVASVVRYRDAADRLREAADACLFSPDLGRFARRVAVEKDGTLTVDLVNDSAVYGLWRFGMYAPDEPRIVQTMKSISEELSNNGPAGGFARYRDDYYFKVDPDTKKVPGNPWFICTLWMAQWYIATAKTAHDLKPARDIINWVVAHQLPGGLLSEQLDPNTGAPLSVSPLTWSAAELIATVDEFCRRSERVRRSALSTVPPAPAKQS
ncbi:MAG TPA: glycoside hydrolase family 15 protein [Candidatus Dormibacteraeota bacterium]|nr:glycoside hydrolase family 15 protein [Candidatus Dormibacteraeota bacterium]